MNIVPLLSCDESNKMLCDIKDNTITRHQSLHEILQDSILYVEIIS